MTEYAWQDYELWYICDCWAAGWSYREIARDMETTKNTIAGLIHRLGYNVENRYERNENA